MDEMEIVDPRTGHPRYRINKDNQVEDLECDHLMFDSVTERCTRCGRTKEQIDNHE